MKNTRTLSSKIILMALTLAVGSVGIVAPLTARAEEAPSKQSITIAQIQGSSGPSPLAQQNVQTEGIVTAILSGRSGLVLQMPSKMVPSGFTGSTAIFIKTELNTLTDLKIGDQLQVSGQVKEIGALDEKTGKPIPDAPTVTILEATKDFKKLASGLADQITVPSLPVPKTLLEQQAREFMVFHPAGDYRVNGTDELIYNGQITINDGPTPLIQPTAAGLPGSETAKKQAAYNTEHAIILDDGNDQWFDAKFGAKVTPVAPEKLPYVTPNVPGPTLGSTVTFKQPVILNLVGKNWVLDPTFTLPTTKDSSPSDQDFIAFSDVREPKPKEVGGDFKLATFNVLNYFSDLGVNGEEKDKEGKKICQAVLSPVDNKTPVAGNWDCPRRGAWDEAGLAKQQAKIVKSINLLGKAGAGVVALQEIENGLQFGPDFDVSLKHLVNALNQADPSLHWAYSPAPKTMPKYGNQDKIRQAFIYRSDLVELLGESKFLDDPAYQSAADARAPISQAFKVKNSGKVVLVINNHLTYKGGKAVGEDNANPGDKQGPAYDVGRNNGDRVRQAKALSKFAQTERSQNKAEITLLVGDFNSYNYEDPIMELVKTGYEDLLNVEKYSSKNSATDWNEYTYSYKSQLGSLDHVMLHKDGLNKLTGLDVWTANAYEPKVYEYSRYLFTGLNYYQPDVFRASDHSAVLVGFKLKAEPSSTPLPDHSNKPDQTVNNGGKPGSGTTYGTSTPDSSGKTGIVSYLVSTGSTAVVIAVLSVLCLLTGMGLLWYRRKKQ